MTDCEKILIQISEFVYVEMDGVKSVNHNAIGNDKRSASFTIIMNDEKEFAVQVKQTKLYG